MRQRLQLVADSQSKLAAARNELRPVALHASLLYSLLSTMPAVNHMYQMSLQQFLQLVQLSLQRLVVSNIVIKISRCKPRPAPQCTVRPAGGF